MSHTGSLKFSSCYIKKVATSNINLVIYFTQYISKLSSFQHVINIKTLLTRYFTFFFFWYKVFQSHCVFYIYSTSQFRPATRCSWLPHWTAQLKRS